MGLDLLGIFGAGLLTFLTPCVLPLVPIYLAALVGGDIRQLSGSGRGQLVIRALWFMMGFEIVFVVLGLGATVIGGFLVDHKAALQALGAVLIALFALKFFGVIHIRFLDSTIRADDRKLTQKLSWFSALVMGVVFAAGWSPCVGPVLGSVLTYTASTTAEPLLGAVYLATYGVGFAVPLIAVAIFAQAGMKFIQKLGPHMRKVEIVIGAFLMVLAVSMAIDAMPGLTASQVLPSSDTGKQAVAASDTDASGAPVMLAFTAKDCPICKRMKPIINNLVNQCDGNMVRVKMVNISADENHNFVGKYHLVGVPTFVFKDSAGDEVARLVGEQTESSLKQALSALRGEPCPGLAILNPDGTRIDPLEMPHEEPGEACPSEGHDDEGQGSTCGKS